MEWFSLQGSRVGIGWRHRKHGVHGGGEAAHPEGGEGKKQPEGG